MNEMVMKENIHDIFVGESTWMVVKENTPMHSKKYETRDAKFMALNLLCESCKRNGLCI